MSPKVAVNAVTNALTGILASSASALQADVGGEFILQVFRDESPAAGRQPPRRAGLRAIQRVLITQMQPDRLADALPHQQTRDVVARHQGAQPFHRLMHQRIVESETGTQLTVAQHPLGHGQLDVLDGIADQNCPAAVAGGNHPDVTGLQRERSTRAVLVLEAHGPQTSRVVHDERVVRFVESPARRRGDTLPDEPVIEPADTQAGLTKDVATVNVQWLPPGGCLRSNTNHHLPD